MPQSDGHRRSLCLQVTPAPERDHVLAIRSEVAHRLAGQCAAQH
jgi:hypothetical protein